jgi:ABC-type Mn2+/Zn2+ transport system ATPase subunit
MSKLYFENVLVKIRRKTILQVDTLQIEPKQFVGIVGPNGAGKTTLLKLICGLQKPDCGIIKIDEQTLIGRFGNAKANVRKLIGYVPQQAEYNADVPFTVREVVAMGRTAVNPLFSRLGAEDYHYVDEWIGQLGLTQQKFQTFRSLSGGEQQKTLIARAMAANPQILLLDEPTANLDFKWKRRLTDGLDIVHNRTSVTILMVSHEASFWPAACGRVLLINKGVIVADDTPKNISLESFFDDELTKANHDD